MHVMLLFELACEVGEGEKPPGVLTGEVHGTDGGCVDVELGVDDEMRIWCVSECENGMHNDRCAWPGHWELVRRVREACRELLPPHTH